MKFIKKSKIISIVIAVIILSQSFLNVYAVNFECSKTENSQYTTEIELTSEEIYNGIDISVYYCENGEVILSKTDLNNVMPASSEISAIFHVGLTKVQTDKAILNWRAEAYQLKNVTGQIYCYNKSTKTRYVDNVDIICPYLDGTTNLAYGATAAFNTPYKTATYVVGYKYVNLRTITKDYYFGSHSQTVTK